jgi:small subunit ribosomal protein S21
LVFVSSPKGGIVVKVIVRDRESIQEAVRRFGKLVMRSKYYEKPSEVRRRSKLRAQRRVAKDRFI